MSAAAGWPPLFTQADQARADRALSVLARPLPRRLGAARARLNLINSILKENQ